MSATRSHTTTRRRGAVSGTITPPDRISIFDVLQPITTPILAEVGTILTLWDASRSHTLAVLQHAPNFPLLRKYGFPTRAARALVRQWEAGGVIAPNGAPLDARPTPPPPQADAPRSGGARILPFPTAVKSTQRVRRGKAAARVDVLMFPTPPKAAPSVAQFHRDFEDGMRAAMAASLERSLSVLLADARNDLGDARTCEVVVQAWQAAGLASDERRDTRSAKEILDNIDRMLEQAQENQRSLQRMLDARSVLDHPRRSPYRDP